MFVCPLDIFGLSSYKPTFFFPESRKFQQAESSNPSEFWRFWNVWRFWSHQNWIRYQIVTNRDFQWWPTSHPPEDDTFNAKRSCGLWRTWQIRVVGASQLGHLFFFWGGGGKKVKKTHRGLLDGDQGLLRCFPILFLVKVLEHHFFWGRNQWYVFFLRCLYKGRHLWQALIWGFGEHPGMGALRIIECLRNKDGKAFMKSTGFKFSTLIFLFGWWLLSYFQYVSNAVCWARDD